MSTLVVGTPPAELQAPLDRRGRAGADRLDEVWEGVHHVVPAPSGEHADIAQQLAVLLDAPARAAGLVPTMHEFNLGESEHDFRVPDGGLHRGRPCGAWQATAALVVEIVSPDDETLKAPVLRCARRRGGADRRHGRPNGRLAGAQ